MKVLISGASIAGPAAAYWLHQGGAEVTVVERSATVRGGGYPIDVRGTALDVVDRMGLLPRLRSAHVGTRRITFLHPDGSTIAAMPHGEVDGNVEGRDVEIPRGDLTALLYGAVRDDVTFRFGDSIATLAEDDGDDGGVEITFASGDRERYDVVVGADGLHSHTRALAFGPEESYRRHLGRSFVGFGMDNALGLAREGVVCNEPGRAAVLYAAGDATRLHGFLVTEWPDRVASPEEIAAVFGGMPWPAVAPMVETMLAADDRFTDTVAQIRMPAWSSGRVVLVGDAAHAPSFLSGQGTSIALVGAYLLASELARAGSIADGFAAYERAMRPFAERNQDLVDGGGGVMLPRTPEELAARNDALVAHADTPGERIREAAELHART